MAIYIQSEFKINPNIARKPSTVMDTSYVFGSMIYADSVEKLPTHPKLVEFGNLGSVPDPSNPNKSILYQANFNDKGKIVWEKVKTGSTDSAENIESFPQEVYYSVEELENMSQEELQKLPENIMVVDSSLMDDEEITDPIETIKNLMKTVNSLQKEITKIKNTFNDMSAVDIEETNSNYGSYISLMQSPNGVDENYPRVEIDWTDSSNGEIVHNGTPNKFGTDASINWEKLDSSQSWFENYHDSSVLIYGNSVFDNPYPYDTLDEEGLDPSENIYADGADEKLTLRHFAPKYAKSIEAMNTFKESLIPYELVLCLENNALYYYNLSTNSMIMLAGGAAGGDSSQGGGTTPDSSKDSSEGGGTTPVTPTLDVYVDENNILNILNSSVDEDGILNIDGNVDENGILTINSSSTNKGNTNIIYDTSTGEMKIESNVINVDSNGILNIDGSIDSNNNLILNDIKSNDISITYDETLGTINIIGDNVYLDDDGYLVLDTNNIKNNIITI